MFRGVGIKLVDFKLEFGRHESDGKNKLFLLMKLALIHVDYGIVLLIKNLDKDRFRKDLGDLILHTQKLLKDLAFFMNNQMFQQ